MKRNMLVPLLGVLALTLAAPACAQSTWRSARPGYGNASEVRRIAYDRGFREGVTEGERDARSRDAFRFQDERDFQRADIGYDRRYGSVEQYRTLFREGFADGYADGYRRYGSRYGNDRYGDGRYGPPYGRGGYGYPQGRDERYLSPYDIGARDGFEKGQEDARDRDRFDPRRHEWYRDAERGYDDDRFGSRERYRDEYRRGFLVGYEQGYRR
jgi:hypothetical protein